MEFAIKELTFSSSNDTTMTQLNLTKRRMEKKKRWTGSGCSHLYACSQNSPTNAPSEPSAAPDK